MTFALVIFFSMLFGAGMAELWHRKMRRGDKLARLKAEYMDKQLWQFISLDEWLKSQ